METNGLGGEHLFRNLTLHSAALQRAAVAPVLRPAKG